MAPTPDATAASAAARPVVFSQPDPRFRGPAYDYIRASDNPPSYSQIADVAGALCPVNLFLPGSRFSYYACAVTDYEGTLVLSGVCVSPLDPRFDGFEDANLEEIASVRSPDFGLPVERDLAFRPMRANAIEAQISEGLIP